MFGSGGTLDLAGNHFLTSGTFWGPASGVIAGAIITFAATWWTLRATSSRRRLLYSMSAATPLINTRPGLPQNIEVRRADIVLTHPQVVTIELTSKGHSDITREAFDGSEPLRLDLGVPIVECLKVTTSPSDRPDPVWKTDGCVLLIGPGHIGKRQTTVFSVLVDGPSPHLSRPEQSLIDVDIDRRDLEREQRRRSLVSTAAVTLSAVLLVAFGVLLAILAPNLLPSRGSWASTPPSP